jgi:hypothetical protein
LACSICAASTVPAARSTLCDRSRRRSRFAPVSSSCCFSARRAESSNLGERGEQRERERERERERDREREGGGRERESACGCVCGAGAGALCQQAAGGGG